MKELKDWTIEECFAYAIKKEKANANTEGTE